MGGLRVLLIVMCYWLSLQDLEHLGGMLGSLDPCRNFFVILPMYVHVHVHVNSQIRSLQSSLLFDGF